MKRLFFLIIVSLFAFGCTPQPPPAGIATNSNKRTEDPSANSAPNIAPNSMPAAANSNTNGTSVNSN